MTWEIWLIIGLGSFLVLVLLIWIISFINKVKTLDNNVENSFAQIDVQLKRRNDLIPDIITVKCEYCGIKNPAENNRCINCGGALKLNDKNKEFAGIAERLSAIVKKYQNAVTINEKISNAEEFESTVTSVRSQFTKDKNFLQLQGELKEIETKIGHFRQFFNDSVLIYNRKISAFPNSILAKIFRFKKKEYLKAETERENQEA